MDCTFCLDCIHACPHDNIGISARVPGKELWHDPSRTGIGKFSKRPDLAALVIVLVFGAFANAAGMTEPVLAWEGQLGSYFWPPIAIIHVQSVLLRRSLSGSSRANRRGNAVGQHLEPGHSFGRRIGHPLCVRVGPDRFQHVAGTLQLSFSDQLRNRLFPVTQRFVGDLGWSELGTPRWAAACCRPIGSWFPRLELLSLDLGLLLSLYTGYRIARLQPLSFGRAMKGFVPWAMLIGLLFGVGIWLVFQPMQMRGTM